MGATGSGGASNSAGGGIGLTMAGNSSDTIGKQTSVLGANGVNIFTEGNTRIKGALIAALNDNLTLNTGTLTFEDMKGSTKASSLEKQVQQKASCWR